MPKRKPRKASGVKWRNVSDRTVAGVKPGGTINRFPDGTNVRALVRAGSIVEVLPVVVEGVTDGNVETV